MTDAAYTAFIKQLNIVLIADRTFKSCEESDIQSDELEMISNEYFNDIFSARVSHGTNGNGAAAFTSTYSPNSSERFCCRTGKIAQLLYRGMNEVIIDIFTCDDSLLN